MARHNVERATGKPSICSNPRRILSYDTPQIIFWNAAKASSLGPKCTVPTSNAFEISSGCWPRTRRPHSWLRGQILCSFVHPVPYDPGLRPGFFGSRFGLSLEKGAAWRLPARRDSSSTLSA